MNAQPASVAVSPEGWTVGTLKFHNDALRNAERELLDERDRRYAEVNVEREKALKIKETADLAALGLAREIQDYKDNKAEDRRAITERESGTYATKEDLVNAIKEIAATIRPLTEYVAAQRGRSGGLSSGWVYLGGAVVLLTNVISIVALLTH